MKTGTSMSSKEGGVSPIAVNRKDRHLYEFLEKVETGIALTGSAVKSKGEQKGLTIVPARLYLKNGKVKVELALARGKKIYDQRETLKRNAEDRDAQRELARFKG